MMKNTLLVGAALLALMSPALADSYYHNRHQSTSRAKLDSRRLIALRNVHVVPGRLCNARNKGCDPLWEGTDRMGTVFSVPGM